MPVNATFQYNHTPFDGHVDCVSTYWNNNDILVSYDGSGKVIYAISFADIDTGRTPNHINLAQDVWQSIIPEDQTNATSWPSLYVDNNLVSGITGVETVPGTDTLVNTVTYNVPWTVWSQWTNKQYTVQRASYNTISVNGAAAVSEDVNVAIDTTTGTQRIDVVAQGNAYNANTQNFRFIINYLPRVGTFGELRSSDLSVVHVLPLPSGTPGAQYEIEVLGSDHTIANIVSKLTATGGTVVLQDADKRWVYDADGIGSENIVTGENIGSARWLVLTLRNAAGEETPITVYRKDATLPWTTPSINAEVTVGSGITVFTGFNTATGEGNDGTGANDGTVNNDGTGGALTTTGKIITSDGKVSGGVNTALDNYATLYFFGRGQGTFRVTNTVTGEEINTYGRVYYSMFSDKTILTARINQDTKVEFIPDPANKAVTASLGTVPANTIVLRDTVTTKNVADSATFKLYVVDGCEPIVTAPTGVDVVTTKKGEETTNQINGQTTYKWDVTVSGMTAATTNVTIGVGVKYNLDNSNMMAWGDTGRIYLGNLLTSAPTGNDLAVGDMVLTVTVTEIKSGAVPITMTANNVAVTTDGSAKDTLSGGVALPGTFTPGNYKVVVNYAIEKTGETGTKTFDSVAVSA